MFAFVSAFLPQNRKKSCFSSSTATGSPNFRVTCPQTVIPPRFEHHCLSQTHEIVKSNLNNNSQIEISEGTRNQTQPSWVSALQTGSVVEVWSAAQINFGLVRSVYGKGVIVDIATGTAGTVSTNLAVKKSFEEIISVWPEDTIPCGETAFQSLAGDVERGLAFLRNSSPRTLDLTGVHARLSRAAKGRNSSPLSSTDIARLVFPSAFRPEGQLSVHTRERRAFATVAGAILVASDPIRFKRAGPAGGWRVLPVSVTQSRQRSSFVDKCKAILDGKVNFQTQSAPLWTRDQLEILREIQIVAASGTAASGMAATALRALGYDENDNGASRLLLDIQYWARGKPASETLRDFRREESLERTGSSVAPQGNGEHSRGQSRLGSTSRDWTFPPEILSEAREVRKAARIKRSCLQDSNPIGKSEHRRSMLATKNGLPIRAYCIDDKKSRFLDDAFSIMSVDREGFVRLSVHIADVDEVVTSGSAIDNMARDRGESLYLPLKPLHMLPAAVMEAASFDTTMATEAITVSVDVDLKREKVRNWEVFASVVPPVTRVDYDLFDLAIEDEVVSQELTASESNDLRLIASAAPILSARLDERKRTRRRRGIPDPDDRSIDAGINGMLDGSGIAAVRLVKKSTSFSTAVKVAEVVDFRNTGSHAAVDDILTSTGALLRRFAKENNAHLPEGQDASSYVARCGTAPLRRYLDLAIQRQIKCVLFGRQPAGRRRMRELRVWLAKRHSAGERTIAEKRKRALFDSFSNHCARQRQAAGSEYAVVRGRVLNSNVTRKGKLIFVVNLEGTGLSTTASVSAKLLQEIQTVSLSQKTESRDVSTAVVTSSDALERAKTIVPYQSRVQVAVQDVDISAQRIQALITEVL